MSKSTESLQEIQNKIISKQILSDDELLLVLAVIQCYFFGKKEGFKMLNSLKRTNSNPSIIDLEKTMNDFLINQHKEYKNDD